MEQKSIIIAGYGTAGKSLASSLQKHGQQVTGFLDDNLTGGKVLGRLDDVNDVIAKHEVTDIYFAIPTASAKVVRDFINKIKSEDVKISIIPRSFDIIAKNTVSINDLTDVNILALIGREPIRHDLMECRKLITGKTVIVTGAAGSIGSTLVKLLINLEPSKIVCLDWWENGTFFLKQELDSRENLVYRIVDIKNPEAVDRIFSEYKPDIVFHAAAYKHVPLMQDNPLEAFNNNVWGSLNMMRQSIKHEVKNFVYVSTDKAVNPVNVMGSSKRLGEMLMEVLAASGSKTKFNAVRFGNVIQSNGSVMQIFRRQIDRGLPLTVTHEEVTRYFMTLEEAAQLIIQSALIGENGEIFVLDMGEPIKVMDLAKSLNRALNRNAEIKIIGLRPGEKMYEELSYDPSSVQKTPNNKIFIVKNEKPFDHQQFLDMINGLTEATLAYKLSSHDVVEKLRSMGFKIKA